MTEHLDHELAQAVLASATRVVRARRLVEVEDLETLAAWADLHSGPSVGKWDATVALGGQGTPKVRDHCLGEIAIARGTGVVATSNALADVLDLRHRLPLTWAVVRRGEAEVSVARRVARLSRHLPLDCVGTVDAAVARVIAREAGGRVLAVAEATIIEADPALHEERAEAERRRTYVGMSRTDEHGLRTIIARVEAGDAHWIDATLTRVVELIGPRHPDAGAQELRSIAFGWLARPAELFELLVEHQQPALFDSETDEAEPSRATAMPADLLDALRDLDLEPLRPRTVLYVHLHEAALHGTPAVARIEGLGPSTLTGVTGLLAGCKVTVKPVIDLADRIRTTAYEHPEALKERVHLTTGGDYWPYAVNTSRRVDYDHPTPYTAQGPPGQTGTHNSGPLGRRHHRWKTHAGYTARQSGAGRYAWLTPHGLGYLVDHQGTRPIPPEHARMIIDAPAGLDIYPGVEIDLRLH
ncbi:hypothetical protein [Nocardioides flavescens]|uniref:DUF222 domain-containing protein n=1 Tax=Nocardioides flavescens TaxID=2691959 RepID=A0A6L7F3J1_9ACTN|nr:hypothetical protein [Nocardioides flavescens]MXG91794.1 hypothetical protein [Nocardioides flavescens]